MVMVSIDRPLRVKSLCIQLRRWAHAWACAVALTGVAFVSPLGAFSTDSLKFSAFDSLFITAATGEPRLKPMRDSCENLLLKRDSATVAYLLAERLTDQTPRQRHYVEKLFGLLSDSGRKAYVGLALRLAVEPAADSVKPQLLYVASTMGDASLGVLGLTYISHAHTEVRRMAARLLGAYPRREYAVALLQGLDGSPEAEKHQRLWALAAVAPYPQCDRLGSYLYDSSLAVRQMAVQALKRCADGKFSSLHLTLPKLAPGDTLPLRPYLAWLELALAFQTPEASAFAQALLAGLPQGTRQYYKSSDTERHPTGMYNKP
jgi:hypothetical protein